MRAIRLRPVLMLLVLPPILAELGSGGMAPLHLFQPLRFLEFATLVYGFPVLVIREVATRRRLGPLGIWCLGIIYGLYNEGLLAQTIFHPGHAPWEFTATYGLVANLRVPFATTISFWHGLFAVLFPIVFVQYLNREKATEPWLPAKATCALAAICLTTAISGLVTGFGRGDQPTTVAARTGQLVIIIGLAVVLWLIADRVGHRPRITSVTGGPRFSWRLFLFGAGLEWAISNIPYILAQDGLQPAIYVGLHIAGAAFVIWAVRRHQETTLRSVVIVALGTETMAALLAIPFGMIIGDPSWSMVGGIFSIIFITATLRLRRRTPAHV